MGITIKLDVVMAERKIRLGELAKLIGITEANLSILKNSKAKGMRFATLESICKHLKCQPGDILKYE